MTGNHDRLALITGGTGGIGWGIAAGMAAAGYRVTVTGATDKEIVDCPAGENIDAIRLDVRDEAAIRSLLAGFDRLSALVNCAGIIHRGGREYEPEAFAEVLDVNLTGTLRMCVAAKPLLAESQGCIVNTASMLSFFGGPLVPGYTASKGGVAQLTKALAAAWAVDGIRVNAIAPGWIRTELTQALYDDPERSGAILGRTPMGRWGRPEDLAGPVLFLCSSAAAFVTGAVLPVDGGYAAV